jgi:RNA polymerase sigma-70 factor (ECF subfamily)
MISAEAVGILSVGDNELIASYLGSGCRDSLDDLLQRHLGRVRNVVYQMVLDQEAADDLTQEVMLKAFRGLASFDGKAAFSTWLFRIAMNTSYSFLARRKRSPVSYCGEMPEASRSETETPEMAAIQAELDEQIGQALEHLSPKLRAAIVLTAIQGVNPADAAQIEGCSVSTMYWRIHEARKQLNAQLSEWLQT